MTGDVRPNFVVTPELASFTVGDNDLQRKYKKFRSDSKVGRYFEEMVRLYDEGWSFYELARKFNIDHSNILRAFQSRNIPHRDRDEGIKTA